MSAGHLGRKTGRGAYRYEKGAEAVPAIEIERRPLETTRALTKAVDQFVERAVDGTGDPLSRYVLARVLGALIVQATLAHARAA